MSDFLQFSPSFIGSEKWDQFSKRELIAARFAEKLLDRAGQASYEQLMGVAVHATDELLKALYPEKE